MLDRFALPGVVSALAKLGHGPKSPHFFPSGLIECRDESSRPLLASRGAGNYEIAHPQRSRGGIVVFAPVRHFGIPEHCAREAVEGDQMRVIGDHENAVTCPFAGKSHAAIESL